VAAPDSNGRGDSCRVRILVRGGAGLAGALDTRSYQKGIKVSKAAMKCLDINGDPFHPEWNYSIRPRPIKP
jgi:hypothetical protein